ncbi:MAG: D-aminoacyl-tRNA deacylase [Myxococcota bacterium]|nr:D-aminoacyl-tRNA deacylase [Myxococcota bacterium]
MRAVVQRSLAASVSVAGTTIGEIDRGLVLLLGVAPTDTPRQARWLADKVANLRIFKDDQGKMNHSLLDTGAQILVISQFTLYGDCSKGRRPNFIRAARPQIAIPLYEQFCAELRSLGVSKVATGEFGAMMQVQLINDGPVTFVIDSKE